MQIEIDQFERLKFREFSIRNTFPTLNLFRSLKNKFLDIAKVR